MPGFEDIFSDADLLGLLFTDHICLFHDNSWKL